MTLRDQPLYERALADPKSVFKKPQAVLEDKTLTIQQKRKILAQWEHDARLIQVAEEEAMTNLYEGQVDAERSMLRDVRLALQEIVEPAEEQPTAPTKFGTSP
jgi:hypothetical protein